MLTLSDVEQKYGFFHDCHIQRLEIDYKRQTVFLHIENIYANFTGLEDAPLAEEGVLILKGVGNEREGQVIFGSDKIKIYELNAEVIDGGFNVKISFSPEGLLSFKCASMEIMSECDQ